MAVESCLEFAEIGETMGTGSGKGWVHEIPNCFVGGRGISGCGRLGPVRLQQRTSSADFRRPDCKSRGINLPSCVCEYSFPLCPRVVLVPACECCHVWFDRSDCGDLAAATSSRTQIEPLARKSPDRHARRRGVTTKAITNRTPSSRSTPPKTRSDACMRCCMTRITTAMP